MSDTVKYKSKFSGIQVDNAVDPMVKAVDDILGEGASRESHAGQFSAVLKDSATVLTANKALTVNASGKIVSADVNPLILPLGSKVGTHTILTDSERKYQHNIILTSNEMVFATTLITKDPDAYSHDQFYSKMSGVTTISLVGNGCRIGGDFEIFAVDINNSNNTVTFFTMQLVSSGGSITYTFSPIDGRDLWFHCNVVDSVIPL